MSRQRRTTIIVVGGALAVASVGYGLGTQAGDGTAIADNAAEQDGGSQERSGAPPLAFDSGAPPLAFDRGAPPGFADLADRLGVDPDALARAMRDFHDQHDADRRHDFAAALAKALGVSTDKVQSAFERLHADRGRPFGDRREEFKQREAHFAAKLANALGANVDDVKAALDKLKDGHPVRFGEFASTLADELGLDVSDVRAALMKIRPPGPDRVGHRPDLALRQFAQALGVSRSDLRRAFRELRQSAENDWKQDRRELAQFLADRLNLDVSKVEDALAAAAPPLWSPHPPPGPRDHSTAL
jgi:transcriptional regulator with XRE-family HTH domain